MRLLRGKPPTPHRGKEKTALRKRAIKISVRLNEQEHEHLKKQAEISGCLMEPLVRTLIMGVNLRPRPPDEYAEIRRQLVAIGNYIDQIARAVNARGFAAKDEIAAIAGGAGNDLGHRGADLNHRHGGP